MKSTKYIFFLYSIISLFLVGYIIGYKNLLPTEIDWLFNQGDLISYYLPWHFYNLQDWSYNIFTNYNYGLEISEGLFFSDNVQILNPLSKFFKNIFNSNFQYVSFWQLTCVSLQGLFSFKIIFYKTKNIRYSFIAGLFFILAPFFLDRLFMHISLAAHWLILWGIYLCLKYEINKSFYKWSVLIVLSIFININLALILTLYLYVYLTFLLFFKRGPVSKKILLYYLLYFTLLFLLFLYLSGFFSLNLKNMPAFGFGYYKSNVLTFIDSGGGILNLDWSIVFGNIKNTSGETEGFAYLGLSTYLFFLYIIFNIKLNELLNYNKLFYLMVIIIFLSLAFTNKLSFGSYDFIEIPLNKYIFGLLSVVRATGRYVWVPAYIVIIFTFIQIYKSKIDKNYINFVLIIILFFQIFDQSKATQDLRKNFINIKNFTSEDAIAWNYISKNYPYFRTSLVIGDGVGVSVNGKIIAKSSFIGTDVIYISRVDRKKMAKARYKTFQDIYKKDLDPKSVYWIHPYHLVEFLYLYAEDENYIIFESNNQSYIVKRNNDFEIPAIYNVYKKEITLQNFDLNTKHDPHKFKSLFGLGWFMQDSFWSDGNRSSIFFKYTPTIKKIVFEVDIFNYNLKTIKNFEFYLNNKRIYDFDINKDNDSFLIEIPFNNKLKKEINNLVFINKNILTRSDITIYPDPRLLGIKIKKFSFE